MVMAAGRWLAVRLDLLTSTLIGAVALAAILVSQDAGKYISRHGNYSLVHFVLAPESYCASPSTPISSLRTHILL